MGLFFENDTFSLYCGDAYETLKALPSNSVQCTITSPPYFDLRDYGVDGQIGCGQDFDQYLASIVAVCDEVKRVLDPAGSFFLNLGDLYHNRNLVGLPWKVAFALQDAGWILRTEIVWDKPNGMPESVKNRVTRTHEYVFHLTKKRGGYFWDKDAICEPYSYNRWGGAVSKPTDGKEQPRGLNRERNHFPGKGRNKRSVWSIATENYAGYHEAVFPIKLVEPLILAGCPEGGTVLDPFIGSGTTAEAVLNAGRKAVGVELSVDHCALVLARLGLASPRSREEVLL